jgi:uncharacterized membrane protein
MRWAAVLLTAAAVLWVVALVAAPFGLTQSSSLTAAFVYEAAARVCHQQADRSFQLAGVQMPVCARCFGLYLSGGAGAVAAWLRVRRPSRVVLSRGGQLALLCVAAPTVISLLAEWVGLVHPSNLARALAAIPLGSFAAWLFVRALRAEVEPRRPIERVRYHA